MLWDEIHNFPIVSKWSMHKLVDIVHSKGIVCSFDGKVLERFLYYEIEGLMVLDRLVESDIGL